MVFPVVMYGCKSWTIKKAECQITDAFKLWCWRRRPLNCKEIQPVHPKGNQSWIFIGRTDAEAELQYFGYLMWRTDSLEKTLMLGKMEGQRRRGGQRMRWLDDITNSKDKSVSKLWSCWWTRKPGMLRSIGVAKTWTQLSDWTELNICLGHTVYTKTAIPPPFLFIVIVHLLVTPRAGTVPNHSCWALHPWSQCK